MLYNKALILEYFHSIALRCLTKLGTYLISKSKNFKFPEIHTFQFKKSDLDN
jgi:hypothetical protein